MKYILMLLALLGFVGESLAKPVNINQADAQTIASSLSGIGIKKAEAIVQRRQEVGEFKSVDELLEIKGIGQKTLEKIRSDILLSDELSKVPESANKKAQSDKEKAPTPAQQ